MPLFQETTFNLNNKSSYSKRLQGRKTSDRLETELLRTLVPPDCLTRFARHCYRHPGLFGRSKKEILQTRNRRGKLRDLRNNSYSDFKAYCRTFVVVCPESLAACTTGEAVESKQDEEDFEPELAEVVSTEDSTRPFNTMASARKKSGFEDNQDSGK